MSTIRSTAIALPPFEYDQKTVRATVETWLGEHGPRFRRVLDAFDRGLVERRRSILPIEEVFRRRSFEERNNDYIRGAVELGEAAVTACLDRAKVRADEVDYFISASCTGFMIPSVDAVLAQRLGMKRSLRRLPITQHGCAGGAVALRQAHEHLLAHPGHRVLVLAVEIPSVTFQLDDLTAENVVSTSIFGDGAAAVLLDGVPSDTRPAIFATDSHTFPDSVGLMGFDLRNSGLKIVLSKQVPAEIREHAPAALAEFLAGEGLGVEDVDHFLLHPGGRKIIEGFETALELEDGELSFTRGVMREYGNLSSATVLFILDRFLAADRAKRADLGLLVAFGPGFGCESLLLRWGARVPRGVPARQPGLAAIA